MELLRILKNSLHKLVLSVNFNLQEGIHSEKNGQNTTNLREYRALFIKVQQTNLSNVAIYGPAPLTNDC